MVLKKVLPIFLFLAFLLQSVSGLWVLASFYINRDYIATNVCVNRFDKIPLCKGKCYLKKELKKQEKQEKNFPNLAQKEIQVFYQEFQSLNLTNTDNESKPVFCYWQSIYTSNHPSSVFHPPPVA